MKKLTKAQAQDVLEECEEDLELARSTFEERRIRWAEAMALYVGLHWNENMSISGADPEEESLETNNYIPAIVSSAVGSRLQTFLSPDAVAALDSARYRLQAENSRGTMRGFLRCGQFPFIELLRATHASVIYGISFLKTEWDVNVGAYQRGPDGRSRREGDLRIRYVSPYNFLPEAYVTSEDSMRFGFHLKTLPIAVLREMFPDDIFGERVDFAQTLGKFAGAQNEARVLEDRITPSEPRNGKMGIIAERWEKPSDLYQGGRVIVFVPGTQHILAAAALPFEFPFDAMYGEHLMPNSMFPLGVVHNARDVQHTIDMLAAKKREIVSKYANPPILNPVGSGISADMFTTSAGDLIDYNKGFMPTPMEMPMIPSSLFEYTAELVATLKDVTGYSDISRGKAQPGMESGRALAILDEFESSTRRGINTLFKTTIAKALSKGLKIVGEYYDDGRVFKTLGPNSTIPMRREFRLDDYDVNATLEIEPFSGAPTSRAARFQETIEALNGGLFNDAIPGAREAREQFFTDTSDGRRAEERHRLRNLSEQVALLEGDIQSIFVLPQDNHKIHAVSDQLFVTSAEFLELDPSLQEFYRNHLAEHEAYAEQEEMQGMQGPPAAETNEGPEPPGIESPMTGGRSAMPGSAELSAARQGLTGDSPT